MELVDFNIMDRMHCIEERLDEICLRVKELEKLNTPRMFSTRYTPHVDYRDVPFWETEEKSN